MRRRKSVNGQLRKLLQVLGFTFSDFLVYKFSNLHLYELAHSFLYNLSTFDIFLALPLVYGVFQGFRKGLLQEVVAVVALFLGFILGLKLLTTALPVVKAFVGNAWGLLPFLSFLAVFVLVILGVRLLGIVLKQVLDITPLGMFDNILGGLLGGLKWCFAISLLLYVSGLAGIAVSPVTARESVIYPFVLKSTPLALEVLSLLLPFLKAMLTTLKGLF